MLNSQVFARRREQLRALLPEGIVVLGGHPQIPLNLPMNLSPARQNSHVLYLTGLSEPESAILLRMDSGRFEVFLPEKEEGDEVWHGPTPSLAEQAETLGAAAAYPLGALETRVLAHQAAGGGPVYSLATADPGWANRMAGLGVELAPFGKHDRYARSPLADAMVRLRLCQDAEGLEQLALAGGVGATAHQLAMAVTRPGLHEAQVRALIEGIFMSSGLRPSYSPIVTVRGEVLHCRANPNQLEAHQLLLVDAGCETTSGYASDITRTWPVRGTFDPTQRDLYSIVLDANEQCIPRVRAGEDYINIHLTACRVIADGLRSMGLLRGDVDDLVNNDAHALFFPHGVGHLLGMDVHDIEDLGDRAGYAPDRRRADRFGLGWLRLNRTLEPGMVVTIEPGIYFIPGLLNDPKMQAKYGQWVNFDKARALLGIGGIRIEDDVVVTSDAPRVLSSDAVKSIKDVEALVGSQPEALGVLRQFAPGGTA